MMIFKLKDKPRGYNFPINQLLIGSYIEEDLLIYFFIKTFFYFFFKAHGGTPGCGASKTFEKKEVPKTALLVSVSMQCVGMYSILKAATGGEIMRVTCKVTIDLHSHHTQANLL